MTNTDLVPLVRVAIEQDDGAQLTALLSEDPTLVHAEFEWTDRKERVRLISPFRYAHMRDAQDSMEILKKAGADAGFLNNMLWCNSYNLKPAQIRRLLSLGVDPVQANALDAALGSSWVFDVDRRHECINALIEGGAVYEDGPVMDIHRGDLDSLEDRLEGDPSLVSSLYSMESGDETFTGITLLHIAAATNETQSAELLLGHGADINSRAQILADGSGGQTPLYHAIGTLRGSCYEMFEFLLAKGADLTVRASMKHDGSIREFTPLGYARARLEFYLGQQPVKRRTAREVEKLCQLGAPE